MICPNARDFAWLRGFSTDVLAHRVEAAIAAPCAGARIAVQWGKAWLSRVHEGGSR